MKTHFYLPSLHGDYNNEFVAKRQIDLPEYSNMFIDTHNRFNDHIKNATYLLGKNRIKLLSQIQINERLEVLKNVSSLCDKVPTWVYNEDTSACTFDDLYNYAVKREEFIAHFEFDFYDLSEETKQKIQRTKANPNDYIKFYNTRMDYVQWCKETQNLYAKHANGEITDSEFYKGLPDRDFRVVLENGKIVNFLNCQIIGFPVEGNYYLIQVLVGALVFEL